MPAFDLVIADEAHRCAGPVSSDFATVLDAAEIKAKRRLFMTATPRYFTGRVLKAAQDADYEVASMDDETKFGTVYHTLTFGEAIKRDLLTDYQVAIIGVDDATYREWAERGAFVTLDGVAVTDATTLAGQIGLAKAMRKYDLHRVISFHSRVKRAREFAASVQDVLAWMPARQRPKGKLWSRHASGEMPAGDRYVLLQHLGRLDDGDRGLLTNARCLAEGVDVPTLDGVAFIDPRRSEVDIVQAVGRAIRKSEDKTIGTIVIPVFIDTDADPEVALDSSIFKPVWDVIRALRSHDDELGKELDELRRQLGRQGGQTRLPRKIHLDVPARVNTDFASALSVRLVEQTTATWEFSFGILERYVKRNGHARVPVSCKVDGYPLGSWANTQRDYYRKSKLDAGRERRLQDLPGWSWDPRADDWELGFRRLQDYVARYGDALVPPRSSFDGYNLGHWVILQRGLHGKGALAAERQRRLQELTGWSWDPRADKWEQGFRRLSDYVEVHGDVRVPQGGSALGSWVAHQRNLRRKGKLNADYQRRLDNLPGWSWEPFTEQWEEVFGRLQQYVNHHGDALVARACIFDGFKLGSWVDWQRGTYDKGKLEPDRQRRLEELLGWTWDPHADKWQEGFRKLLVYMEDHGHARVPVSCKVDGYNLGGWAKKQRDDYAKGTIKADRRRQLEDLAGWSWGLYVDTWAEGFSRLLDYVDCNGDARVPTSCTMDGFRLGGWAIEQRSQYVDGKIDLDRQRRLENLDGWTWDTRADKWENGFRRLLDYVEENGHARVPQSLVVDGYRLGAWVNAQRNFHARGTLDSGRKNRLEGVKGWAWDTVVGQWDEVSATSCTMPSGMVTPASPSPTPSMATNSAGGSRDNAATTPKASLTPIANADLRRFSAGRGRHGRRANCLGAPIATVSGVSELKY